jgi:hypothetical protein
MNTIGMIEVYKFNGYWVFDDAATGLSREAFVAGADMLIDNIVADIPNAETGFICVFSKNPFPTYQYKLKLKTRGDDISGNWYTCEELEIDSWLCGSLYKYFDVEPETIYIEVKESKHAVQASTMDSEQIDPAIYQLFLDFLDNSTTKT